VCVLYALTNQADSLSPWITNCIQDHKTKYIPFSKMQCYLVLQTWSIYVSAMSILSVALLTSQIDFLMIRLGADLLVNSVTTWKFLKHKVVDKRLYDLESRGGSRAPCDASVMEMTSPLDEEAHPLQENGG